MPPQNLEITEFDDAGTLVTTYIESPASASTQGGRSRVDIIHPQTSTSYWKWGLDVFLPAGYPHSVTADYLQCVRRLITI